MAIDLEREPEYDALFETLLEKTRDGKLVWQETAHEKTFVAAVKGVQTFEITGALKVPNRQATILGTKVPPSQAEQEPVSEIRQLRGRDDFLTEAVALVVRDSQGNRLFQTPLNESPAARELFRIARRMATRIDEKIEASLELLGHL